MGFGFGAGDARSDQSADLWLPVVPSLLIPAGSQKEGTPGIQALPGCFFVISSAIISQQAQQQQLQLNVNEFRCCHSNTGCLFQLRVGTFE